VCIPGPAGLAHVPSAAATTTTFGRSTLYRTALRTTLVLGLTACLATPALAADDGKWGGSAALAALTASGNSSTQSGSVKLEAARERKGHDRVTLKAGGLYSRSDGNGTAESANASGQYDYFHTAETYSLYSLLAEHDAFAGFDYRITGRLGGGHRFIHDDNDQLDGEVGLDYVYEYAHPKTEKFPAARLYGKWVHTFREGLVFTQDIEFLENLDSNKFSDLRTNTLTALEVSLSTHLSLKTSVTMNYDTDPVEGKLPADIYTATALVVTY